MPERMSDKTFKGWRDRLQFAKSVWERNGMIGTAHPSNMRLLIELYRGNQWAHLEDPVPGVHERFFSTVNKVFPVGNTIQGEVGARNPKVEVFPRNPDAVPKATPVEHLINYDIDELNLKRQTNKVLMHHLFAPFGVVRHGFTPSEEFETDSGRRMQLYRPAKPDRPYVRATPIWNVLMDPTAESFHVDDGMWWVAFRDLMRLKDIKDNPNMIAREELASFTGNISPSWENMRLERLLGRTDPDRDEFVEVFTVYEARERSWFQMTLDGVDKPLRQPDDWPIDWETLPVSIFQVNEQMDTPFPLSIMDEVAPIQVELNRLRTMMGQLVFRLRRIIGYNKAGLDDADVTKIESGALNEIIGFKGTPQEMMQLITSGVFPQELLQYNALLEEDIREVIGQSKMGRAQRINVESATEASNVQRGQDVNTARIAEAYQTFWEDLTRLYMQGRRATMDLTGGEVVRIVGQQDADGVQRWGTVDPGDLHGDFDFRVVPGSTLPMDRDREAAKAGADLTLAQQMPNIFNVAFFARKYLESRGLNPMQGLQKQALVASAVKALDATRRDAQIGEEGPAGGGNLNPAVALAQVQGQGGGGGAVQ